MRYFAAPLVVMAIALLAGASHAEKKHVSKKTAARAPSPKRLSAAKLWHSKAPDATAPTDETGRPMLVLQTLNHPDRVALPARGERGGFSAEDLDRAAHVLRDSSTGNEHPIDPRVLDLAYRVQTHFSAHEVRVISGYRTPRKNGRSNHGKGRAIDLVVPGASDQDVAKYARELGFVGVGVYPVSGFVHLDVRERSYFWVDRSGPGKRSRIRGILADVAAKSDAAAIARGERAVGPFQLETDVDLALARTRELPAEVDLGSEDDDTDTPDE